MIGVIISFIVLLPVITGIWFYLYRKYFSQQLFAKEGIPGPKPDWLMGNLGAFADVHSRHLVMPKWTKQYGKVFGIYEASKPVLVTSDVDFITQVFVKQFQSFHKRKQTPSRPSSTAFAINSHSMFHASGDRWKRLRTIVNPTFSAGKMKAIMPLMNKCQADFMLVIDNKAKVGKEFNIFDCYKLLTMDTISEAAFGIELNSAKSNANSGDKEVDLYTNPVLSAINELFKYAFNRPMLSRLHMMVPEFYHVLYWYEYIKLAFESGKKKELALSKIVNDVIESRRANKAASGKRQDLLQMMMDVEASEVGEGSELKGLTTDELNGQSVLFMLAGYETSSNALAFSSFLLANYPGVQDKLIAEIDNAKLAEVPDYDSVQALPYLECVINETLRVFPVAPLVINRMASEDTVVNGFRIPEGLPITADIWSVHRDEEQWGPVDPEQFHPERFMDDYPTKETRSEAAFLPFGFGPRICIGMRFAMLEIKLTLINILRKYRIAKSERTGDTLKLKAGATITPADGVYVKLVSRTN